MTERAIHPLAYVERGAEIGKNVTIEPFATVKNGVILEDGVTIKSHAHIEGNTTIGQGTTVFPFTSIGAQPQFIKYKGETTYVKIGKNCIIRESVTINASAGEGTSVEVGDDCFIMAYCHIAHNCRLGRRVVMSNNATLAGHVDVEDFAIIGGMTPVHQFVRIGKYAMVGGLSRIPHDVPPFTIGAGIPFKFGGLNLIGLKRNGFDLATRSALSKSFRLLYRSRLHLEEALLRIEREVAPLPEVKYFIDFCRSSKRGLMGLQGVSQEVAVKSDDQLELEELSETALVL